MSRPSSSSPVPEPLPLTPALQRYAWGDPSFIAETLGLPVEPIAEAWYGAHPLAPATVDGVALDTLIADAGAEVLGEAIAAKSDRLPYLLKLLAAGKPLSIQVHPTKPQAEEGYAREEQAGVDRAAKHRCYRDDNHKPEVLVALREVWALCGFREADDIAAQLEGLPELTPLLPPYDGTTAGLRSLLERYFSLDEADLAAALSALVRRLSALHEREPFAPDHPSYWALEAHRTLGRETPDRGLLFVYLLALLRIEVGQAIFLPAGVPHAYLRGAGVELMASSDNVLRAGLTPKHVAPAELMRVMRFDAVAPPLLEAIESESGEAHYTIPAAELAISHITLTSKGAPHLHQAIGPQTLLALPDGATTVTVSWAGGTRTLDRGQACLLPAGCEVSLSADGDAALYCAGVPASACGVTLEEPSFRGRQPTRLAFGTSGLRGLVEDITDLEAYINTRGFLDVLIARGEAVPGTPVALGGDLRPSTHSPDRSIKRAVARAILDAGMRVVNCGALPTPALTLYGLEQGWPSVMVTGSHIPFDRNGIKFNKPAGEVLKSDEAPILAQVARVREREYGLGAEASIFDDGGWLRPEAAPTLPAATEEARERYRRRYLDSFPEGALAGLRLGFYEHSAVGRELVVEILRDLGAEVVPFGRSTSFVAIDTEAIAAERLEELQRWADQLTAEHGKLDALLSTDGDSDRPMLLGLDDRGRVHFFGGDVLGAVVARTLGVDAVAVPISANDLIDQLFATKEGVAFAHTRIGSPWVIAAMQALRGERRVGWEANGGFLIGSPIALERGTLRPLPTRDAVLPLCAALWAARREGVSLVELFAQLPARASRAGLLDEVPTKESQALLATFAPRAPLRQLSLRQLFYDESGEAERWVDDQGGSHIVEAGRRADYAALRQGLARHFSPERGFGALRSIDRLDGLRLRFDNGDVAHVRPSGNAPQLRIYAVADSPERAEAIVAMGLAEPDGILRGLVAAAQERAYVEAILRNIAHCEQLFSEDGASAAVIGMVAGSEAAQAFWQRQLDQARASFCARRAISFYEDLPVNQAFGLLLLWQRLREELEAGEGALVAFVFGEGTRATPLTEAEGGQKPAIASFATMQEAGGRRALSTVELALRTFAPVEAFLRRSGFDGMVVKWGDEVQIPTRDLSGRDELFADADVVRFVSLRQMTEDTAANKDWVGVDEVGHVTAFIPRRPLGEMVALAERGLLQRQGDKLYGGVNLGSIALSRLLCEELLEEFGAEVNDPAANRKKRPDLDPQLFTALTIAAIPARDAREEAWAQALDESASMRKLDTNMPEVLPRLRAALDRFERRHGRPVKMVALDFQGQYWADIGQHRQMRSLYMALREQTPEGEIARSLAGLVDSEFDARGNIIAGGSRIGEGADVRGSLLIDAVVESGEVVDSVLIGSRCERLVAREAFDLYSSVADLELGPGAGSYKIISAKQQRVAEGERLTTVFLPDKEYQLRVHEETDLRDRAASYDKAILGNALAFNEAHQKVLAADPEALEDRRARARKSVEERGRRGR
ncbi:MAG: mannose-6-phosphate isomerase, class I [Deltaproteobacteria bacterium]|nr:MAG: mannose-6-phosphate isomerase, class I [Pseudomonadota bacterium]PIE66314.1 MAG: mannose-6-phosphate isomerase, class I [Deltaproteobacteria bacterium]